MYIDHQRKFIFIHVARTAGASIEFALGRQDTPLHQKLELIPNWEEYFSFAFVRNPWDRAISSYMNQVRLRQETRSFENYTKAKLSTNNKKKFIQYDMVKNCTYIGRFEHLNEDLNEVCSMLNIKIKPLPHVHKSKRKSISYYYNQELIDIINTACSGDISMFGFSFLGGSATKMYGLKQNREQA